MSTTKRGRRHARDSTLTPEQELELVIGPKGKSVFPTEGERRRAYLAHQEELLRSSGRAWGWVTYAGGGFLPSEGSRITAALARIDSQRLKGETQ